MISEERADCRSGGGMASTGERSGENGMKAQDLAREKIVQGPEIALPASLGPALLMLHRALIIEELWQGVLMALQAALEIHNVSMALFPAENSAGILLVSNPASDSKLDSTKIDAMSPAHAFLARRPGACVLRVSDAVQERPFIETPFYKNFVEPEGSRFAALMVFREGVRIMGWLYLGRRAAQGDFTSGEMTLLDALYVQLVVGAKRVCRFERERRSNKIQVQNGRDDPATLLLDERFAPVFHNRSAVRICALWTLGPEQARILKPEFHLPAEIRSACRDLGEAWQKCCRKGRLAEIEGTRIATHPGGLSANVRLLRMCHSNAANVYYLVHLSHSGPGEPDLSVLRLLHRLTTTERAVAKLVAWGFDNQEIAKELWISVNTVRVHLHNIFHKLGVNCRGKLAVLMR
jgi:DNA-binding CsgD family transcriptional regulator